MLAGRVGLHGDVEEQSAVVVFPTADHDNTDRKVSKGTGRITSFVSFQLQPLHVRLLAAQMLVKFIPYSTFGNIRSAIYRWSGFENIANKVYIFGTLDLRGMGHIYPRLHIGEHTHINTPCLIELGAEVRIGQHVSIGHHTLIVTSTHDIGPARKRGGRRNSKPVEIGDGAWIGAGVTILPGTIVGAGAIVTAGSVVTRDVPPNAQVAGNPARVVGWLDGPASEMESGAGQSGEQPCSYSIS
jgi:acetyltransferase-like isoleucine patch superfamily enzyme